MFYLGDAGRTGYLLNYWFINRPGLWSIYKPSPFATGFVCAWISLSFLITFLKRFLKEEMRGIKAHLVLLINVQTTVTT